MIYFCGNFSIHRVFLPFQSIVNAKSERSWSTSIFPYMLVISILSNILCDSKNCCFEIHFVNFHRSIQIAAIMLQTIPSFYAKISEKSLFISATTYEKYIVCKDYCISYHDNKTCSLSVCIYHNILLGEIEDLLHKLDTFCFTYQHVDCVYNLFKYHLNGKIIAFDKVQRAISCNQRNRGVDKMLSIAIKRSLRKSLNSIL